ncbi:uncharacterized protein SPAPADRAFT_53362 [Spathaspora passalidarum NRRL Y-27907]|uniref:Phospholipid/glycerol acyltransferase domain-containing protein n=1 Tax=Spathaspora passalidarum (strain NRRL Y-27907 / 11-Y1) TaxID=619300 RepID=G3AFL0_SPAPN|nr:uncharacterized protein SPAPADRAFT_53362 [Spathaspora passalidarum NRRL Y-27907]EGW34999.1 hypothetical protein SPAPADRAFT_53362 [Spathaspora passalidarum NRRL Y-27907]
MEKFSAWRDKATGISPFMPTKFPLVQEPSAVKRLGSYTLKTPIFIVKFPFFVLAYLLYTLTRWIGFAKFVIQLLFGLTTTFTVDGVKKSQTEKLEQYKPKAGDVLVTNYISPLDGFIVSVLANSSNTVFLIPNKQGTLYQYSALEVFNHCFSYEESKPVDDLSKLKNKIVVLLLEGTPSNNKSLLPFIKLDNKYNFDGFNVKSLVLKLSPSYFTLPIPYLGKFQYLFQLLTNLSKCSIKIKIYKFDKFDLNQIKNSFELNALTLINQELNLDSKQRFINYYFDHNIKKDI